MHLSLRSMSSVSRTRATLQIQPAPQGICTVRDRDSRRGNGYLTGHGVKSDAWLHLFEFVKKIGIDKIPSRPHRRKLTALTVAFVAIVALYGVADAAICNVHADVVANFLFGPLWKIPTFAARQVQDRVLGTYGRCN